MATGGNGPTELESCAGPVRLAPPEARASACTFAVSLLDGTKVLDRALLAQPGCGPASPNPVSLSLGADRDSNAWNTNDDNCDIDIAARTVKLGPDHDRTARDRADGL